MITIGSVIILTLAFIGMIILISQEVRAYLDLKQWMSIQDADLDSLYKSRWNGQDNDRIYAWYRTIRYLEETHHSPAVIAEAHRQLSDLKKDLLSSSYICVNGKPTLIREIA